MHNISELFQRGQEAAVELYDAAAATVGRFFDNEAPKTIGHFIIVGGVYQNVKELTDAPHPASIPPQNPDDQTITLVPRDLIEKIFSYCHFNHSNFPCKLVCKKWESIWKEDSLWKQMSITLTDIHLPLMLDPKMRIEAKCFLSTRCEEDMKLITRITKEEERHAISTVQHVWLSENTFFITYEGNGGEHAGFCIHWRDSNQQCQTQLLSTYEEVWGYKRVLTHAGSRQITMNSEIFVTVKGIHLPITLPITENPDEKIEVKCFLLMQFAQDVKSITWITKEIERCAISGGQDTWLSEDTFFVTYDGGDQYKKCSGFCLYWKQGLACHIQKASTYQELWGYKDAFIDAGKRQITINSKMEKL